MLTTTSSSNCQSPIHSTKMSSSIFEITPPDLTMVMEETVAEVATPDLAPAEASAISDEPQPKRAGTSIIGKAFFPSGQSDVFTGFRVVGTAH